MGNNLMTASIFAQHLPLARDYSAAGGQRLGNLPVTALA